MRLIMFVTAILMFGQYGFSRGLERLEKEDTEFFGFVKQEGDVVSVETKEKIFVTGQPSAASYSFNF